MKSPRQHAKAAAEPESAEADETLRAIRSGEVDALVVTGPFGAQVVTLEGAETPYRVLIEQMNEGAATMTLAGAILFANRRFTELFGTPMERLVGERFVSLIDASDAAAFEELLRIACDGPVCGELTGTGPGCTRVPLKLSLSVPSSAGAGVVSVVATDLGETKRRELELRHTQAVLEERLEELARINADLSNSRAAALNMMEDAVEARRAAVAERDRSQHYLDVVDVMVVAVDVRGRIVLANRKASELLDRPERDLIGRDWIETCVPGRAAVAAREAFERRVGAGPGATDYYQDVVVTRGGAERLIAWRSVVLPAAAPSSGVTILSSGEDVTERKSLEDQFRQAQKMEAVGQLAGGIAHDFNNILTAVLGYSEMVLERVDDDEALAADVREIKTAGERAARLTQQLLAFSRKQRTVPEALGLNEVLSSLERMLRRLLGEDVRLELELGADVDRIIADRGLFEQVIVNLCVNSRDAMPHGGTLTLSTANVTLDREFVAQHVGSIAGPFVAVVAKDNGCGMTREVTERIFEPFFTTKEPGKGTGLGLATVYGIVKQAGGYITVDSTPAAGTTFTLYFPRLPVSVTAAHEAPQLAAICTGTETILVVEDEPQVRSMVRRVLEPLGYRIVSAAHGAEAIEIAARHATRIDLLLTDVVMADMDGLELAEIVQQRHPGTAVMFMSGFVGHAVVDSERLRKVGGFLPKPFSADTLARQVRDQLGRRPLRD